MWKKYNALKVKAHGWLCMHPFFDRVFFLLLWLGRGWCVYNVVVNLIAEEYMTAALWLAGLLFTGA